MATMEAPISSASGAAAAADPGDDVLGQLVSPLDGPAFLRDVFEKAPRVFTQPRAAGAIRRLVSWDGLLGTVAMLSRADRPKTAAAAAAPGAMKPTTTSAGALPVPSSASADIEAGLPPSGCGGGIGAEAGASLLVFKVLFTAPPAHRATVRRAGDRVVRSPQIGMSRRAAPRTLETLLCEICVCLDPFNTAYTASTPLASFSLWRCVAGSRPPRACCFSSRLAAPEKKNRTSAHSRRAARRARRPRTATSTARRSSSTTPTRACRA